MTQPPCRIHSVCARYAAAATRAASAEKVPLIDVHGAMTSSQDWRSLLCDGLHFTPDGQRFVWGLLESELRRNPELLPEATPRLFPHVSELQQASRA
jgi:hypothetical protein